MGAASLLESACNIGYKCIFEYPDTCLRITNLLSYVVRILQKYRPVRVGSSFDINATLLLKSPCNIGYKDIFDVSKVFFFFHKLWSHSIVPYKMEWDNTRSKTS